MTFKEFFNKKDNSFFKVSIKPAVSGMSVIQDFSKANLPDPTVKPSIPKPSKPVPITGRTRLGDRPVEKKPTNFLPRSS